MNDIIRITFQSLSETVKNQGYIIKDLMKQLKSKVTLNDINPLLNLKANNADVYHAIDNLCNSIENLPTISQINELNQEKVSKNELINYLKDKPSMEDIESLLQEKTDKKEFNIKLESIEQNFEKFKKDMMEKMDELVTKKDFKIIENKEKEIMNILDRKAEKENVFNSLKKKSDKNEINTILDNKLDKADLANILKLLEDKLNKEEFLNYTKMKENEFIQNNNKLDDTYLNIVKEINNSVQEMKKNMNTGFDIVNIDIEKINENLKSKYESINSMINNLNNRKLDSNQYITSIKNKLDIDKFDSLIKKIKNNLQNNFVEISKKNTQFIEELINNKINEINTIMNEKLNSQNSNLIKNIEENKNRWAEYQIDIQSVINKNNSENKLELKKLRNEFLENLEVKITDKFYELTDESKNNKNNQNSLINHNSLLNSNDNEIGNKNNKNTKSESQIKEKCEINEINMKLDEIKEELKNNRKEFSNTLDNQALINETLCEENKLGKWYWTMGKLKNNYNIIWDNQVINTFPDNYILENEKSIILIKYGGIYEIIFGFYGYNRKPNIQILVNNEVIISNLNNNKSLNENGLHSINTTNSGFFKSNRNIAINGGFRNITGITLVDYIYLDNNSKLSVFYGGDTGKGFVSLKQIINNK